MDFVSLTVNEGIARIALRRGKVNAINEKVVDELTDCFRGLSYDRGIKAILLTGPLAAAIITTGHTLSARPVVCIIAMFGVAAVCGILLYRFKKPWIYTYAAALAAVVGIFYAWPRPELNEPQLSILAFFFACL